MDGTKAEIRHWMRRRRRALGPSALRMAECGVGVQLQGFGAYRDASVVLLYVAVDNEVPTAALMQRAFADGKRVLLPRMVDGRMAFAEHREGMLLRRGALGIPEPSGEPLEVSKLARAVAFIPLLAWDDSGGRLGRGGAHYDRALREAPRSMCLVGLGYAFQQCTRLPRDWWDLRLEYVVTERAVVPCCNSGEALPLT